MNFDSGSWRIIDRKDIDFVVGYDDLFEHLSIRSDPLRLLVFEDIVDGQQALYVFTPRVALDLLDGVDDTYGLRTTIENYPTASRLVVDVEGQLNEFVADLPGASLSTVLFDPQGIIGVVAVREESVTRDDVTDLEESKGYGDPTLRRTPHLDAPEAVPVQPGSEFTVSVRLDDQSMAEEEDGTDVVIQVPDDVRRLTVQIELLVSPHFRVTGDSEQDLLIDRDAPAGPGVTFTVCVSEGPPQRHAGMLAMIKYRGRPCGHVSRAWDWAAAGPLAPFLPGHAAATASLPIHVDAIRPDITVTITQPVADGQHFVCSVESILVPGFSPPRTAEFGLPVNSASFVADRLAGLVDANLTAKKRRRNLKTLGYELWNAAPANFQELIWAIFEAGLAPASLYIASTEPAIPWELMIPHRNVGTMEERKPLGLEFTIGRWTRGDAQSPPQRIPIRNAFVIAPTYSEKRRLSLAAAEVQFVVEHLNGRQITPATEDDLDSRFATDWASVLHFVCHGAAEDGTGPALYLDHDEVLDSPSLLALEGFKILCRKRAPLVFINACEAGLTVSALVGNSGFPAAFGEMGARAIIAPLWPIDDTIAHEIALDLYRRALEPDALPIAEILRQLRVEAYERDDADTYAAYAFFGDPLATAERVTRD